MKAEREIVWVAFPFAAAVAAAVIIGGSLRYINPAYHITSLWANILSAAVLLLSMKRDWGAHLQWGLIWACSLSCGVFVGLNGLELNISGLASDGPLAQTAQRWAAGLEGMIEGIPFKESHTGGIVKALLTGNKENIPPEVTQAFRDSGASHILALSGLHLGIIYMIAARCLAITGNSKAARTLRSLLTVSLCGLYTIATGAGASITRAFIFIALKETAEITGRRADLKGILAASLMIHVTFDPLAVTEIGFQLSYAAMLGIAFIYPKLKGLWKNNWPGLKWIWNSAALSVSCQLTTGPLAFHYFGTFPQYFLLTNLLAVPLTGLIIPAALLTVTLTAMNCCPEIVSATTEQLIMWMTDALRIIASM